MSEWWQGRPVAVVGAGLTGASWAGLFAAAGLEVRLLDRDAAIAREAMSRATAAARFLIAEGLADRATAETGLTRLKAAADPEEAYAGAGLVQECVVERLDAKQEVFAVADRLTPHDALLATSSSGLSITAIQEAVERPRRCLAAHPYNPPHLVPLVELAPGEGTSPATMLRAEAFYRGVGKEPVVLARDVPGYVANRLSVALWREAIDLIASGVASVADVDRAVTSGPGLRWAVMGPHLLYHLGGGSGGIAAHLEQLRAVKEAMLENMVAWTRFPEATASLLAAGLDEEVGARTMEELASQRDAALAAILRSRRVEAARWPGGAAGGPASAPAGDEPPRRAGDGRKESSVDTVHPEEAITIFRTVRDFRRKGGLLVRPIPNDVFTNAYRLCFTVIQAGIAAAELNENREEADRLRGYVAEILEEKS